MTQLDVPKMFNTWLRQSRIRLDLTQESAAELIGCAVPTLRAFESGKRRPSRDMALRIAEVFAIPPSQLADFLRMARSAASDSPAPPVEPPVMQSVQAAPPLPSTPVSLTALPLSSTALIGRAAELAALQQQLCDPACRLMTLLGPGGIGKSRLALQVAQRLRDQEPALFHDGVAWVSLTAVTAAANISDAIAGALGISTRGTQPSLSYVQAALAPARLLLVLDGMEHLLDAATILSGLLESAPELTILVTSRERLRIRSERVFHLDGLPLPAADRPISESPAVLLFLERARQVRNTFSLTPDQVAAISTICRLLEGMPLGIELAASWVRVLSPMEIAAEIQRNLDFLSTTDRDLPARHRSLRAVFEHSWRMLSPLEQHTLMQLSVLRGGGSRAAAEALTSGVGPLLPTLALLIDKSLLRRNDSNAGTRYDMHELVRQYAAEQLAANSQALQEAQYRHYRYFLELFLHHTADVAHKGWEAVWAGLRPDMDNLRQAWDWALQARDLPLLQVMAPQLAALIDTQSWLRDGIAIFSRSAALLANAAPGSAEDRLHGQFQIWLGAFLYRNGQVAQAREQLRAGIARLGDDDQQLAATATLGVVGIAIALLDDYNAGRQLVERRIALLRRMNDDELLAHNLVYLAIVAWHQGDYAATRIALTEADTLWPQYPNRRGSALSLLTWGMVELSEGHIATATTYWQRVLQFCSASEDSWARGAALAHLGRAAVLRGELEEARALTQEAVDLAADNYDHWSIGLRLGRYGQLAAFHGDTSAITALRETIKVGRETAHMPVLLIAAAGMAALLARTGAIPLAQRLLAIVRAHHATDAEARMYAARLADDIGGSYVPTAASQPDELLDLLTEAEHALER